MDTLSVFLIILMCFAGSLVQAACGFGFAVVVMGVLSSLLPSYGEAAGLANLLMLVVCVYIALRLRKRIRWRVILWPLITCLPVSFCMVRLIAVDPSGLVRKLLGAALILLAAYFIFLKGRMSIRQTPAAGLALGVASGVLGGLFCMGGVPMALYLFSMEEKEEYLATIQAFFAVMAVYSAVLHGVSGFLSGTVLRLFLYCLPVVALGTFLGKRFFARADHKTLERVIYGFMLLSGVFLLLT